MLHFDVRCALLSFPCTVCSHVFVDCWCARLRFAGTGETFLTNYFSSKWDTVKPVEQYLLFSVLLEDDHCEDGQHRVISEGDSKVICGATTLIFERQMPGRGYEEVFEIDFNGDEVIDPI